MCGRRRRGDNRATNLSIVTSAPRVGRAARAPTFISNSNK